MSECVIITPKVAMRLAGQLIVAQIDLDSAKRSDKIADRKRPSLATKERRASAEAKAELVAAMVPDAYPSGIANKVSKAMKAAGSYDSSENYWAWLHRAQVQILAEVFGLVAPEREGVVSDV